MASDKSLLDMAEGGQVPVEGFLPHAIRFSAFNGIAAVLFLAAAYFLLWDQNMALFLLSFLGFAFTFHSHYSK